MNKLQAEKIVEELNAILMNQPLAKAVEDSRFEVLQQRLKESEWRTIIDEFQIVDGKAYGRARLVDIKSAEAKAIYGSGLNSGALSCARSRRVYGDRIQFRTQDSFDPGRRSPFLI